MKSPIPRPLYRLLVLAAALAFVSPGAGAVVAAQTALDLTKLGRPANEVARDATSKPLAVYRFFGIAPGAVVADLFAGGGYNTAILTHLAGDGGLVFSQDGRKGPCPSASRAATSRAAPTS